MFKILMRWNLKKWSWNFKGTIYHLFKPLTNESVIRKYLHTDDPLRTISTINTTSTSLKKKKHDKHINGDNGYIEMLWAYQ